MRAPHTARSVVEEGAGEDVEAEGPDERAQKDLVVEELEGLYECLPRIR